MDRNRLVEIIVPILIEIGEDEDAGEPLTFGQQANRIIDAIAEFLRD